MNKLYSLRIWMLFTAAFVLICDQYTKHIVTEYLAPDLGQGFRFPRRVPVIEGFFDLNWAANTGGAFSFMHTQPWIILMISSVLVVGILIWAMTMRQKQLIVQLAFGLIIGGAVGNLVDRVRYRYVVDFLHFYFVKNGKEHFWPTFNVADMAIVAGIGTFMYLTVFTKIFDPPAKPDEPAPIINPTEPNNSPND